MAERETMTTDVERTVCNNCKPDYVDPMDICEVCGLRTCTLCNGGPCKCMTDA